jgi:Ca-activated chloride channel family protein
MLTFAHSWIVVLLPLPWLLRALLPPRRAAQVAVRVPFGDRLRDVQENTGPASRVAKRVSWHVVNALLWVLLLTAIARPQWLEPPITKDLPTRDLLLLVDLSGSMQQEDFLSADGTKIDRLTAVKEVLGEFLQRREGPFLQAPFSTDLNLARQLLNETVIGMAGPRTAFGDSIGLGITLFDESDAPAKTIIALTDGNDTKSQMPPIEAARIARERDIRIHTVAIGDPATVGEEKLDEDTLRDVARTAGGSYFFAADRAELAGIYTELDQIETRQVQTISHRPRRDLYYWPLLAALALSLMEKTGGVFHRSRAAEPAAAKGTIRVDPMTGKLEMRT